MHYSLKKIILPFIVGSGIITGYIYAQSTSTPPAIGISQPMHDFGVVDPGVDLVYDFPIKNLGGQKLHISQIHTSCGCVKDAHIDMDVISAGKTGYLHVVWQPGGGEISSETIDVQSNDPKSPQQKLSLKAQIKSRFSVTPAVVNYGLLERSDLPITREVEVEKFGVVPADATLKFESKASYLQTSSKKVASAKWNLQLVVKSDAPLGPIDGRVTITPTWPGGKPYNILVLGKVIGGIAAEPDEIYVDTSDQGSKFRSSFQISAEEGQIKNIVVDPLDEKLQKLVTVSVDKETVNLDFLLPKLTTPNTFRSQILCEVTLESGKKETLLVPISLVR